MVSRTILAVLAFVAVVAFAGSALAGEAPAGGRGGRGAGGPGGGADFRTRMMDNIKTSLGVTDEEWKVLQPQVEKVQTLSRQVQGNGMMGMMRRNRGGAPGAAPAADNATPPTKLDTATQALTTVLENKDAKPEEIKTALTAVRDERAKVKAELDKAKTELKGACTMRMEAQFVLLGMFE